MLAGWRSTSVSRGECAGTSATSSLRRRSSRSNSRAAHPWCTAIARCRSAARYSSGRIHPQPRCVSARGMAWSILSRRSRPYRRQFHRSSGRTAPRRRRRQRQSGRMMMHYIFRLGSFPIEQTSNMDSLERRLGDWFASLTYPVRLLALSRRFDMRPPIRTIKLDQADLERLQRVVGPLLDAIDGLLAGDPAADPATVLRHMSPGEIGVLMDLFAGDSLIQSVLAIADDADVADARILWGALGDALDSLLWRLPWAKDTVRFYEALQQRHLRSATYVLITWPPPDVSAAAIAATLRHAIGREVQILDQLPSVIDGPYVEQSSRLRPEQAGAPWLACLLSCDARGAWDATTLHGLLDVTYDVAVAVDVVTLTRNQGMRTAEMAFNAARVVARDAQVVDMRAQRVVTAAERVMHELVHESLHTVQIGVLVGGTTEEELETNVAETSTRLGTQLRFMRPAGVQGEVLKLWSPTPRNQIEAPSKPRTMLSHGVGCCAGLLGYHRASATDGLFWGDGRRAARAAVLRPVSQ